MRYRWIALGIILSGFVCITYVHTEISQQQIVGEVAGGAEEMGPTSDTYAWLDQELESLRRIRALLDTMDAVGFRTEIGETLRRENRSSLEQMERMKLLTFLQDSMWRQALYNIIWGVFGAAILLPLAAWLDTRRGSDGDDGDEEGKDEPGRDAEGHGSGS
ncbi:MAG: hypothetical protein R6W82_10700 [bacterium]